MSPVPAGPLPKDDDTKDTYGGQEHGLARPPESVGHGITDGIFLDFLYPQQALALLHKRSTQQWQKWEKRNVHRLPDGFVVASRGYASRARAKQHAPDQPDAEDGLEDKETVQYTTQVESDTYAGEAVQLEDEPANPPMVDAQSDDFGMPGFVDSPTDLAEPSPEAARKLRTLMAFNKKKSAGTTKAVQLVDQAWHLYQALDDACQDDATLKAELLSWLNLQQTEKSDMYCAELYHSMSWSQRTLQVYETALSMFLRRDQHLSASKLHGEALQNLKNGHQISRILFRYAIDNGLWRLAIRTEGRHKELYGDSSQTRLFWLHVSETPQLLSRALKLVVYLQGLTQAGRIDSHTQRFCATFFREAIAQEFMQTDATFYTVPNLSKQGPPKQQIRQLFSQLFVLNRDAGELFEQTLMSILGPNSRIPYVRMHGLVTTIYNTYKNMRHTRPSEHLLIALLRRVTQYADRHRDDKHTRRSLSVASVVRDWKSFHRKLSTQAHARLLVYHAKNGHVELLEAAMRELKEDYPGPEHWKDLLWTSVYMYARKADLDGAQQAFAAIKRELAELGDEPDLKCWNTLLHAHSRADDLQGALTNLQNLIDYAKLRPDAHSFHPVMEMFAKRGDADGVEDLLEQYDNLARSPRTTALLGSLVTALVRSDDIINAEKVLEDTVKRTKAGEITGSLTQCFNIMLGARAASRDLAATRRTYQWMKEENIRLDANSYAAMVFALSVRRQTDAAYSIVTTAMRESGVEPTAFHYSLVMAGYNNVGRVEKALAVHEDMTRLNIKPTLSTHTAYLQARAQKEDRETFEPSRDRSDSTEPLHVTLQELLQLMQSPDGAGITAKTPQTQLRSASLIDAELSARFDFLLFIHGRRRCLEAVQELYARHQETAAERGLEQDAPPIRLLTALMSAHWRAGNYDEVEASWKLAKQRADDSAPAVPVPVLSKSQQAHIQTDRRVPDALELEPVPDQRVDISASQARPTDSTDAQSQVQLPGSRQTVLMSKQRRRAPQPAPNRRHILTRPLRYYLASLYEQNRLHDLITTVSALLSQGYVLDNRTFNFFVECLCRASPPLALLAFTLTERFLIPNFPGWVRGRAFTPSPQARAEGLQNIRARYLKPGTLMPQYKLLVRLGSVLLDVRRLEAMGRKGRDGNGSEQERDLERYVGTMKEIRRRAPKTLFAVQSMPRRPDRLQSQLLRREW